MNKYPREVSCYSCFALILYALEHGYDSTILFEGIEDRKELLENPHEWTDFASLIRLCENFKKAGGDLFRAGMEITESQVSHFQLFFLKVASLSAILNNFSRISEKTITPWISFSNEIKGDGIFDIIMFPRDKKKYSIHVCDFNRGCALGTVRLKRLRNVQITELTCAARSDAPECRYRVTWTPDPPIVERLKEFFGFRFRSQKSILAHIEENYNRLQEQYNESKKLNDQLMVTLGEKAKLSDALRELNVNLERKVAEQTADIRTKNEELQHTNTQLKESERMKDLLTGALVHDIKNHIFSMACDVHAINDIPGCPEEVSDVLRHTAEACSSAMSLAANMLDIGKMEEGKLVVEKRPFGFGELEELLERYTGSVFFNERRISVCVERPGFPLRLEADHYLVDRVLQNLLTNAAMYTPRGGEVKISFGEPSTIRVFNTGEPIPEQYRGALFGKYARVTTDSSKYSKGLGLFFCKLVMEAHGGSIGLECAANGNCFVLEF